VGAVFCQKLDSLENWEERGVTRVLEDPSPEYLLFTSEALVSKRRGREKKKIRKA